MQECNSYVINVKKFEDMSTTKITVKELFDEITVRQTDIDNIVASVKKLQGSSVFLKENIVKDQRYPVQLLFSEWLRLTEELEKIKNRVITI